MIRRAALALLAALPALAAAHEVLHTVERGRAVAVHVQLPGGEHLAGRPYEVFSPADPMRPHQQGRTDRKGWLSFVPDAPGAWRVRIADGAGHGLDVEVDAFDTSGAASSPGLSTAAFVLRPVAGVLAIGAIFAALVAVYRRKSPRT